MASFLDVCRFTPTLGGTTDWTYSTAVTGYQSPALAGVQNGTLYKYRAESADLSQWELGEGAYNTATGVLARTTVFYNSAGTGTGVGQSGAGTKISFSTVPQVAVVVLKEDVLSSSDTQLANKIYAGPAAASGLPAFRSLVAADGWSPLVVLTAANSANLSDTTHITSAYDLYRITLTNLSPFTNNSGLNMRITEDAGGTFPATSYVSSICGTIGAADLTFRSESSTSAIRISGQNASFDGASNASAYGVNGVLFFQNPNSTTSRKSVTGTTMWMSGNASRINVATVGGLYDADNTVVNGLQFFFSAGNILSGTIKIDGMKTS